MPTRLNPPPSMVNAFRRRLARWYQHHRRDLPWRRTRDPYRILVSEMMLQQTRVEVARDYYRRWLRVFPNVRVLAQAHPDRVLKQWEGLGYYARARYLHRAAQQIVRAGFPRTRDGLRCLPGVGRYTAGAVASIAFGESAAVVDGNVARVLSRVFHITGNIREPATLNRLWALAGTLLPATQPGEFNQALMELGALVCVPSNPRCGVCPLKAICSAPGDLLPNRGPHRCARRVTHNVLFVTRNGKVLLRKRPSTGLLAGMWELPEGKLSRLLFALRHTIMNQRITLRVHAGKAGKGRWVTRRESDQVAMPAAHRRALVRAMAIAEQPQR